MNHQFKPHPYHAQPGEGDGVGPNGHGYENYEGEGVQQSEPTSDWYEVSCVEAGGQNGRGDPIQCIALDPVKELVWVGTAGGMLHSHYAADMARIVSSYVAEPSRDSATAEDVRDVVVSKSSVLAAMSYGLAILSKGGVRRASVQADTLRAAKGLALSPVSDNHVCMGGDSRMLAVVDLEQQRILRQATLRCATSVTRALWAPLDGASSLTIFSTATGRISFCDPATMREINAVAAFTGAATSIASCGYYLAATGLGTRGGVPYLEQYVKMFDVRALDTPLPSVMFPAPPMFTSFDAFTSEMYNTNGAIWILSPNGLMQCLDISAIASGAPAYPLTDPIQLDAGADTFTAMAVSPQGLLVLGDSGGFVHQWSCYDGVKVNADSESVWSSPISTDPPAPSIRLDGYINSDVGVPIPKCALPDFGNSYLTDDLFGTADEPEGIRGSSRASSRRHGQSLAGSLYERKPFGRFPLRISDEIVKSAKRQSFVGYARAPVSFVRNSESGHKKDPVVRGMFGKSTESGSKKTRSGPKAVLNGSDQDLSQPHAKSMYVEMDLVAWESIEGFNFFKYNKSALFCGLENALPNVYVNAAVQVLYFTAPIRRAIANHECDRQWCISCELGFLFHMFDLGGAGMACEAGNFSRAFMTMANAGALGLLDGPHALPLAQRIENFTRYLLEQLHKDDAAETSSMVSALFGAETISFGTFSPSNTDWERKSRPFQHTLMYDDSKETAASSFCDVLEASLSHSLEPTRAFCEASGQFETMSQRRELKTLPNMLLLGCNTKLTDYESWWCGRDSVSPSVSQNSVREDSRKVESARMTALRTAAASALERKSKLLQSMHIELGDEVSVTEIDSEGRDTLDEEALFGFDKNEAHGPSSQDGDTAADYDLSFVIAHVPPLHPENESRGMGSPGSRNVGGHIVAYIRVPREYRDKEKAQQERVNGDGLNIAADWWCFNDFVISPCDGFAEVAAFDSRWKKPCLLGYVRRDVWKRVDSQRLEKEVNVREVIGSEDQNAALGLRDGEETPGRGTLLGLDCEFVMVGRDEAEIFGDGTRQVVVPARLALARVSVIRGDGELKGKALIDDYVAVREPVVDYLTRFSGLEEGDLDVERSRYKVSSLKTVYKRLRCLVDAGCTFVGHGLKSDFRIINFVVPPEQVVDTVTLFRAPNKRLLGLRFLSNTLLGGDIQSVTHDSIEDSDAALRLHELYLKLKVAGEEVFQHNLKELYAYGYANGWRNDADKPFVIDWSGGRGAAADGSGVIAASAGGSAARSAEQ